MSSPRDYSQHSEAILFFGEFHESVPATNKQPNQQEANMRIPRLESGSSIGNVLSAMCRAIGEKFSLRIIRLRLCYQAKCFRIGASKALSPSYRLRQFSSNLKEPLNFRTLELKTVRVFACLLNISLSLYFSPSLLLIFLCDPPKNLLPVL